MNPAILTGKVISEVKVTNTTNGTPLCRFTLEVQDRKFNCIITGMRAYKFMYYIEEDCTITIEGTINERMQLIVQKYDIISCPSYFSKVYDSKRRMMPHIKIAY